jgi:diacylglycerol kinase (ATP)
MDASGPVPLIHNPAAGGGRGSARFHQAKALLEAEGIQVDPIATRAPRHATRLVRTLAADGYRRILVLGGDGTLSEAADGAMKVAAAQRPTLGFIPAGTGNDVLRDHGVLDRAEAVKRIVAGNAKPMDAMRVRYQDDSGDKERFGINLVGIGFAPKSVEVTNRRYKWARGQAYNLGTIHSIMALKPTPTRITIDGRETIGDFPMALVCNNIYTGGAMKMAPMAKTNDGVLDIMTVGEVSRMQLLGLLGRVRSGGHANHPAVQFQTGKSITIEPEEVSPLLVDGEVYGATPVTIDVMPSALKVFL